MKPDKPNVTERRGFLKALGGLTAALTALPAAAAAQCGIEPAHAFPDELDAAVGGRRQRVEYLAVEHERRIHRRPRCQRPGERVLVEVAEVAAEPDQGAAPGRGPRHGATRFTRTKRRSAARSSWRHGRVPLLP